MLGPDVPTDPPPGGPPNDRVMTFPALLARRLAALFLVVAAAMLAATAAAAPAAAHAELATSDPVAGAQLDEPPDALTLDFTENVHLIEGGLRLLDGGGAIVTIGTAREDARSVVIPVPEPLAEDGYVLTWRVLSADSHPLSGSVPFTVGDAPPAAVAAAANTDSTLAKAALAVSRWLGFLGLVLMIGPVFFVALCWAGGVSDRRVARLVLTGAGAVLLGTAGGLLVQGPYVAGQPLRRLTDTELLSATLGSTFGQASAVRVIAVLGLLFVLDSLRRRASAAAFGAMCAAALATFISYAVQGHAIGASTWLLAVSSDTLHLTAMTTWIGGLAVLAVLLSRRSTAVDLADVLPRWSRVALSSVLLLTVTGTIQSLREVGSLDALTTTSYGRLLLVKLALFAGLLGLGNLGRVWIRRRYTMTVVHAYSEEAAPEPPADVRALRRSVAAEAGLAAVVLAVTAVLVATTPARVAAGGAATRVVAQQAQVVSIDLPDGTTVDVGATPDRAVTVLLEDSEGEAFDPEKVSISASLAGKNVAKLPLRLGRADVGSYRAEDLLPFPGAWRITVTVQDSPTESAVGTADLDVP